jgi:stage II sporulation protein AB (anti-sigma F factor)
VKKGINNELKLVLPATKGNAMVVNKMLSAFLSTIDDIDDVKSADIVCAVDEAVNNVVDHAYVGNNYECDDIVFEVKYTEDKITIFVTDKGVGIKDLQQARVPLYTSGDSSVHSGMGFTVMESFSDLLDVKTKDGAGTKVKLVFQIV